MQVKQNPAVFKKLIYVLSKANLMGYRHDWAWRYSNGRTESTKELTDAEMLAIINELDKQPDPLDKMRKKILAQAHQMGWELPTGKVNMQRVNDFCLTKGPYKKKLDEHNKTELTILVSIFQKMYRQYMDKI